MTMKVRQEDFEVLPRGTLEELTRLRQFFGTVQTAVSGRRTARWTEELSESVESMERFYETHVEKYPL